MFAQIKEKALRNRILALHAVAARNARDTPPDGPGSAAAARQTRRAQLELVRAVMQEEHAVAA